VLVFNSACYYYIKFYHAIYCNIQITVDGHDIVVITSKQKEVNDRWEHLNELAKQRRQALATAYLVHEFKK